MSSKRPPIHAPNRIAALRTERGWSMAELAQRIGVTPPTIDKLEKRQIKLTDDYARRLANVFHCRWYELFEDAPTPLDAETQRMIEIYQGLAEEDRRAVFRHAESLPKTPTKRGRKPEAE